MQKSLAPQVSIPGRSPNADGSYSEPMLALAQGAVDLYHSQQDEYDGRTSERFVFSGSESMVLGRLHEHDEGFMIAHKAMDLGLPEKIVKIAGGIDTFDNFYDAIKRGYLNQTQALDILVHGSNGLRAKFVANRLFPDVQSHNVGKYTGIKDLSFDIIVLGLTSVAYLGVPHKNPERRLNALSKRNERLRAVTKPLFGLIQPPRNS